MTFGECDQRALVNPRGGQPFGRILAAHAFLSVKIQRVRGKLRDDIAFPAGHFDVTSDFEDAPNIRSFLINQPELGEGEHAIV